MEIRIDDTKKLSTIQTEFSETFPYLMLEFFTRPHNIGTPSPKKIMIPIVKTVGQCRSVHTQGKLTIIPSMTVAALEQVFNETYGLSVQVFRKSGNVWLETTVTDGWTLEKQNRHGEELSK